MLHPDVLAELLDGEIAVAAERLAGRCTIERHERCIHARSSNGLVIRLDGGRYDAEPFAVAVISDDHEIAPASDWPVRLNSGEHPVLQQPFVCARGTAEYHTHPSHLDDRWDLHRGRVQLVDLLRHLLDRAST